MANLMVRIAPIPELVVRPRSRGRVWRRGLLLAVLWALSLGLAWLAGGYLAAPLLSHTLDDLGKTRSDRSRLSVDVEEMRSRLAVAERASQVAQAANQAIQETLGERDEEVAALRADLGFYQALIGGKDRRTLGVHKLSLQQIPGSRAYGFNLTLTQNLKKSAVTVGTVQISVEGVRNERLVTLGWRELAQDAAASPLPFSFKYFQRLQGTLLLPQGFSPNRIVVSAESRGGERTQHAFAWSDALAAVENDNVGF